MSGPCAWASSFSARREFQCLRLVRESHACVHSRAASRASSTLAHPPSLVCLLGMQASRPRRCAGQEIGARGYTRANSVAASTLRNSGASDGFPCSLSALCDDTWRNASRAVVMIVAPGKPRHRVFAGFGSGPDARTPPPLPATRSALSAWPARAGGACSASVINSASLGTGQYILTADHCFTIPGQQRSSDLMQFADWVVLFDYDSDSCDSRKATRAPRAYQAREKRGRSTQHAARSAAPCPPPFAHLQRSLNSAAPAASGWAWLPSF